MNKRIYFVLSCFLILHTGALCAQEDSAATPLPGMRGAPKNMPDISVIGDIRGRTSDITPDPDRNKIFVKEIEIAMQGYLYPEMRADVFFSFDREAPGLINTELEEAYVSFLQLGGGFNAKAGKMLVDFGKLNKLHPELWMYVDRPLVLTNFLGGHGLNASGADAAYLFPLPFFLQVDLGIWNADAPEPGEFGLNCDFSSARLWSSFSLTDSSELEMGASGLSGYGPEYPAKTDDVQIAGFDITYKNWPSTYKRFIFQVETLALYRKGALLSGSMSGLYAYLGYKFDRFWDAGIRYDLADSVLPLNTGPSLKERKSGVTLAITDRLTEITRVRLQAGYGLEDHNYTGYLQLIFGIGSHSHSLQ